MKALVLAAGQGTRLRPLTDDVPKAMVSFRGLPLLEHARRSLVEAGVPEVVVVTGYRAQVIADRGFVTRHNPRFDSTNMVASLFCAEADMAGGFLVVYGNIVFRPGIVRALLADPAPLAIAYNTRWRELWSLRLADPLADAETFRLDGAGFVTELGRRPRSFDDVEGQYAGLVKVSAAAVEGFQAFYAGLDRTARYEGRSFDGMFMTTLLQLLIDSGARLKGVPFAGGWAEVDSVEDLRVTEGLPATFFEEPAAHGTR